MSKFHCCHFEYLKNSHKIPVKKETDYTCIEGKEMVKVKLLTNNNELISEDIVIQEVE